MPGGQHGGHVDLQRQCREHCAVQKRDAQCKNAKMQECTNDAESRRLPPLVARLFCIRAFVHSCNLMVMNVAIVNPVWDARVRTPAEILDRFRTLTGWANAVHAAGAPTFRCTSAFTTPPSSIGSTCDTGSSPDGRRPKPSPWYDGAALCEADRRVCSGSGSHQRSRPPAADAASATTAARQRHRRAGSWRLRSGSRSLAVAQSAGCAAGCRAPTRCSSATPPHRDVFAASGMVPATLTIRTSWRPARRCVFGRHAHGATASQSCSSAVCNANKDPLTVLEGFARLPETASRRDARRSSTTDDELEAAMSGEAGVRSGRSRRQVSLVGAVRYEDLAAVYARADLLRARQPSRRQRIRGARSACVRRHSRADRHSVVSMDDR